LIVIIGPPDPLGAPSVLYLSDLVTESADRALVDFIEIAIRACVPLQRRAHMIRYLISINH